MKTLRVTGTTLFLMASRILTAGEKPESTLVEQFSQRPSVAVAGKLFPMNASRFSEQGMTTNSTTAETHSTFKAVAMSALIPGAGQAYNKSWIKAAAFLAMEAGGWIANRHYDSRGDVLTGEFEAFADAHWSADRYYDWLAQQSGTCQRSDLDCLKQYERETYSHFLPDVKSQTYYENIGKYDQFNSGWDDTQGGARDSANREKYDFMRADANDQYNAATLFASALLLNHVISAIDAAWTTNRYNKKIVRSSFGLLRSSDRRLHPALTLRVEW